MQLQTPIEIEKNFKGSELVAGSQGEKKVDLASFWAFDVIQVGEVLCVVHMYPIHIMLVLGAKIGDISDLVLNNNDSATASLLFSSRSAVKAFRTLSRARSICTERSLCNRPKGGKTENKSHDNCELHTLCIRSAETVLSRNGMLRCELFMQFRRCA